MSHTARKHPENFSRIPAKFWRPALNTSSSLGLSFLMEEAGARLPHHGPFALSRFLQTCYFIHFLLPLIVSEDARVYEVSVRAVTGDSHGVGRAREQEKEREKERERERFTPSPSPSPSPSQISLPPFKVGGRFKKLTAPKAVGGRFRKLTRHVLAIGDADPAGTHPLMKAGEH